MSLQMKFRGANNQLLKSFSVESWFYTELLKRKLHVPVASRFLRDENLITCYMILIAFKWSERAFFYYPKILKISPWAYIFQRPFLRGLFLEGNLHFKTDSADPMVGRKFTIFALFYFVFEGNF